MAAIKSRDTKPEMYLRKLLFSKRYRYRIAPKNIPGHPDIWLAKYRTAIFMNGCFWHRHEGCRYCYMPKSNTEYWKEKFDRNIERDKAVREELKKSGIRQIVVWECTVKKMQKDDVCKDDVVNRIEEFLTGEEEFLEI